MSKYKYGVKETTKEQRKKYVERGELSKLGGGEPSAFVRTLSQEYVNGNMEYSAMKNAVIARYRKATNNE